MNLAYAVAPFWMMIAAVYLLIAVPLVFFVSVVMFGLTRMKKGATPNLPAIPLSILVFSILNLGLPFYFFFWLREPGEEAGAFDWLWTLTVVCSPILLSISTKHAFNAKHKKGINS